VRKAPETGSFPFSGRPSRGRWSVLIPRDVPTNGRALPLRAVKDGRADLVGPRRRVSEAPTSLTERTRMPVGGLAVGPAAEADEAAEPLSVRPSWIYEAVRNGTLPFCGSAGTSASRDRCSRPGTPRSRPPNRPVMSERPPGWFERALSCACEFPCLRTQGQPAPIPLGCAKRGSWPDKPSGGGAGFKSSGAPGQNPNYKATSTQEPRKERSMTRQRTQKMRETARTTEGRSTIRRATGRLESSERDEIEAASDLAAVEWVGRFRSVTTETLAKRFGLSRPCPYRLKARSPPLVLG
jgi:hypothetical protein